MVCRLQRDRVAAEVGSMCSTNGRAAGRDGDDEGGALVLQGSEVGSMAV